MSGPRLALDVLRRPARAFAEVRDDSRDAAEARQETLLAIVWLAGIAGVLGTNVAARALDDFELDALSLAVWAFVAGGLHGLAVYLLVGALVYFGVRAAGGVGSYRQARHVLGLAAVPVALSLAVWAVRVVVFGDDVFRSGGSDTGPGNDVFERLEVAFLVWSIVLVAVGIRVVHGWSWPRAAAATLLPALVPALALARANGLADRRVEGPELVVGHRVAVLVVGERGVAHVRDIRLERAADLTRKVRVALHEPG